MTTPRPSHRWLAGLAPLAVAALALPLMAPTCGSGTTGTKTFARGSLVIPMDRCFQYSTDDNTVTSSTPLTRCPAGANDLAGSRDPGDVVKAYGLVYELVRNNIPVYWVINPAKTAPDDTLNPDITLSYSGGPPAYLYDWNTGGTGAPPVQSSGTIGYIGGPFVVDGSDAARASTIMQAYKAGSTAFASVNVHVSNVAFQATVAKTMAGGWSAGGTTPPKLALLDIGSGQLNSTQTSVSGAKNSEPVIEGYLIRAGIGGGTAAGTSAGPHGEIYDKLGEADFLPPATSTDPTLSPLFVKGYQILWVPHWLAEGSCANVSNCFATRYPVAQIRQVVKTIGSFVTTGHDLFAECAGIGSFEGVLSPAYQYPPATTTPQFQATNTVGINPANPAWTPSFPAPPSGGNNFASPLMQIGDFGFKGYTGVIQGYQPAASYRTDVVRLIADSALPAWDYFTFQPGVKAGKGTVVYLAGHSYSGTEGSFQIAGSRLVLNTLFNLGASCVSSGVACTVPGKLGVCAQGTMSCCTSADVTAGSCSIVGDPFCKQTVQPSAETCNGLDDDCNGLVDDMPASWFACYDGPAATRNVGLCHDGVRSCDRQADGSYAPSACKNEQTPQPEVCNGVDDDCGGNVDQVDFDANGNRIAPVALTQVCYGGPAESVDPATGQPFGECKMGTQTCQSGAWGGPPGAGWAAGVCAGENLPKPTDTCAGVEGATISLDSNCNGKFDCGTTCNLTPTPETRPCYTGPNGTLGTGICTAGIQTCVDVGGGATGWSACQNQTLPQPEQCDARCDTGDPACPAGVICRAEGNGHSYCAVDHDCNGQPGQVPGGTLPYDPAKGAACGVCKDGDRKDGCYTGPAGTLGHLPCKAGYQICANGAYGECQGQTLPGVEICNGIDDDCDGTIDDGAQCITGYACISGVCAVGLCGAEQSCQDGYDCDTAATDPGTGLNVCRLGDCGGSGAACGGSGQPACPTGQACDAGVCHRTCTTGNVLTTCGAGFSCTGGFCECSFGLRCVGTACTDPCDPATVHCGPDATCAGGFCTAGGCYSSGCAQGTVCSGGSCVADPCSGVLCPSGTFCRSGDCVQACAFIACQQGQRCGADGFCAPDACAGVACGAGQTCSDGRCLADPCTGLDCGAGRICAPTQGPSGLVAACVDDPCTGITCPAGTCAGGQCYSSSSPLGYGTAPTTTTKSGGCGCGTGGGSSLALLALLLAAPLARRRARGAPSAAALAAVLAAVTVSSGCSSSKKAFDATACAETCGEQRCVDLGFDPGHCGACGSACAAGQQCVDSACGPASAVAPYIQSISPGQGPRGGLAPVQIEIDGQRLQSGAELRVASPAGTATLPTELVAAGRLTAALDLSQVGATTLTLRIVNPDRVISNALPFDVTLPTPVITNVSPPSALPGAAATFDLTGSGFITGSQCHIGGGTGSTVLPDQGVPTTFDGTALHCTVDFTFASPGTYQLWVVNDGALASNKVPVGVTSSTPSVSGVSPGYATQGSTVAPLAVLGDGFDRSSQVWLRQRGQPTSSGVNLLTSYVDARDLYVATYTFVQAAGAYEILVVNGATESNAVPFTISSSGSSITVNAPVPAVVTRGAVVSSLAFTGTNIPLDAKVQLRRPSDTTFFDIDATIPGASPACAPASSGTWPSCVFPNSKMVAVGASSVTAQLDLSRPDPTTGTPGQLPPEGLWDVRLTFTPVGSPTTVPSTTYTLRVLSNEAILRSVTPAGGAQGGSVGTITLSGSGFQTGAQVLFQPPVVPPATVAPAPIPLGSVVVQPPATATAAGPSMIGIDTGVYSIFVRNPYAPDSNALSFTVTPGPPTLTSVSPASASQATTPVLVTLAGGNFARPDANGNGGSVVHVSSTALGIADSPLPVSATTVVDHGQIQVSFDTRTAVPGTYVVSVWNATASGVQKSAATNVTFTLTP